MKKTLILLIILTPFLNYAQCVTSNSTAITNLVNTGGSCTFDFLPNITVNNTSGAAAKKFTYTFTSGATVVTVCYTGNAAGTAIIPISCSAPNSSFNPLPINSNMPQTPTAAVSVTIPCNATVSFTAQTSGSSGPCAGPTALGPFPVTLTSFTGKVEDNSAVLRWATSEETNSKGFEVQKSIDAFNFKAIGMIDGSNNSKETREYHFVDKEFVTTSYYRLNQIDYDGKMAYSRMLVLIPANESLANVALYPNPTQKHLSIKLPTNTVSLKIYRNDGTMAFEKYFEKRDISELDVSSLPSGTYLVEFTTSLEHVVKRLVIAK